MREEWIHTTLGVVTTLVRRGRAPAYANEGLLVLNQKCIRSGNKIDYSVARRTDVGERPVPEWAIVRDGDVLVNSTGTGTAGRAALVARPPELMTVDSHITIVRSLPDRVVPEFIGARLSAIAAELEGLASGSTNQIELSRQALADLPLHLPPLSNQQRIVDLVGSVDGYIDSLQTQVEATRAIRLALLAELLTNPGDDWISVSVEESCEILDRLRRPISSNERAKRLGNVPYYGATGQAGWIDEAIFNEPLVLLGEDAVDFASRSAKKAYCIDGPSWVNNHAHVLKPGRAFVNTLMLELLLNEVDYIKYAVFGTRSKLTQASMRTIRLSVPSIAEQRRVIELISSIDKQVESLQSQVSKSRSFRAAALSELLSGERLLDESYDVAASQ